MLYIEYNDSKYEIDEFPFSNSIMAILLHSTKITHVHSSVFSVW